MSGHQSGSDRHQKRRWTFFGCLTQKAQRSTPRNVRRLSDAAIGLEADHVYVGGYRHRDGPGHIDQVTVAGDVISRAPHLNQQK